LTRTRRSAKTIGTQTERDVADYLANTLHNDQIDRRTRNGIKDRGDITGIKAFTGQRLVIEVKNCTRINLPEWTDEAHTEAGNDDALVGVVVSKRSGTRNPGRYWVHMTLDDLCALLTGTRHGHRQDFIP
jgi:hypothetical protein